MSKQSKKAKKAQEMRNSRNVNNFRPGKLGEVADEYERLASEAERPPNSVWLPSFAATTDPLQNLDC